MIGFAYPGDGQKLPYSEMSVEPVRLEGESRSEIIDRLVEELTDVVGINRAENGALHIWSVRNGLSTIRLVAAPDV